MSGWVPLDGFGVPWGVLAFRQLRAIETGWRGGVVFEPFKFDIYAATDAIAEFAFVHTLKRRVDALNLDRPPAFRFKLHGLGLQGIHAR